MSVLAHQSFITDQSWYEGVRTMDALIYTERNFWHNVTTCSKALQHPDICPDCCWLWSKRPLTRPYSPENPPKYLNGSVWRRAWSYFHCQPFPARQHAKRSCRTLLCVNPLHVEFPCDLATLMPDDMGWTCPHL